MTHHQRVVSKLFWFSPPTQSCVRPCPSRSILSSGCVKAAILNHVSRRTSNEYWASAYFNINSLEVGIVRSRGVGVGMGGVEFSSSRENPRYTLIRAVMFYRSHFSMPPLTALEVIKLQASRKEWESETKYKSRGEREKEGEREWEIMSGKTDGLWRENRND